MSGWHGQARSRTQNMYRMLVTLDVLKLSDWLNASAFCRVQREADWGGGRRARRRKGVGAGAQVTRGVGPTGEWEAWAGAESAPEACTACLGRWTC